jgi:hypothetical protein
MYFFDLLLEDPWHFLEEAARSPTDGDS